MYKATASMLKSYMFVFLLVLLSAACSREAPGTPARMEGNIMYGQSGMDFVLENIAVFRTRTELIRSESAAVEYLKELREKITIKVFMGSWCVDAQLHVPVLFKALQQADNARITVQVIGLDRRKKDLDGLTQIYGIDFTPTFVVEYKGREIGRIIETPSKDAASDVVVILRGYLSR